MRLATTTGDFDRFCDSYLDRVKSVHAAGFKNIDLSLYTVRGDDELMVSPYWQKCANKLLEYADKNGLSFVQAHSPGMNPLASEQELQLAIERNIRAIEVCGALGIPNMVVHPGWDHNASKEQWFERNRDFFRALFPTMERCNVHILHENTTKANMSCYYSRTGAEMVEFSKFVDHPMFHSCWDTGHANCEGPQYDEIKTIGDDLYALHINDNRGKQDEHVIPFFGTVNMDEIMTALKDIGYRGVFTFESGSSLRPSRYWLGNRFEFATDTRLANPPLELQQELERFMYTVGKYILTSYNEFEG